METSQNVPAKEERSDAARVTSTETKEAFKQELKKFCQFFFVGSPNCLETLQIWDRNSHAPIQNGSALDTLEVMCEIYDQLATVYERNNDLMVFTAKTYLQMELNRVLSALDACQTGDNQDVVRQIRKLLRLHPMLREIEQIHDRLKDNYRLPPVETYPAFQAVAELEKTSAEGSVYPQQYPFYLLQFYDSVRQDCVDRGEEYNDNLTEQINAYLTESVENPIKELLPKL